MSVRTTLIMLASACLMPVGLNAADGPVRTSFSDQESQVELASAQTRKAVRLACDDLAPACGAYQNSFDRRRTPAMIGDFFGGSPFGARADSVLDRLLIVANDLDAPLVLPPGTSALSITEAGPIGAFSTSLASIQELQSLLRSASPLPGFTLAGTLPDAATLTTLNNIAQIQAQLASTGAAWDIIALQNPPAGYANGLAGIFAGRNGLPGTVSFNAASSGALLQAGGDSLAGGEDLDAYYFYDYALRFDTALADAASGGVGRLKIAEGGTVLPTDRVFFRYNNEWRCLFQHPRKSNAIYSWLRKDVSGWIV